MSDVRTPTSVMSENHVRPSRAIVLCFDGTNAQYDAENTNVVKFFGLLRKDCMEEQVSYYQAGIGTYFAPGAVSPLFTWLASLLDEVFAWYLDAHVMGGYKFIMDNYRCGDKICLFGFSRGAYTARALAGMLTKVGLLPRDNLEQVDFAYKAYKRTDEEGIQLAAGFKHTFSRDVKVEFVGVWDTVRSTGVMVNRELPFTSTNTAIRIFRQALSLDEHRSRFRPNLYHFPEPDEVTNSERASIWNLRTIKSAFRRLFKRKDPISEYLSVGNGLLHNDAELDGVAPSLTQTNAEFDTEAPFTYTDVLEVWFSGCHSDIGGGNVRDDVKVSLAQIPLHWMVEQVIDSKCGILFDDEELADIGFKLPSPSPQPPVIPDSLIDDHPTSGAVASGSSVVYEAPREANQSVLIPESYLECADAIAPLFDQLEINKLWWLLEIIPSSNTWQDCQGKWHTEWSINLGRGRFIPSEKPKFHHTVKQRMDYEPLKYKPRAIWDHDEIYV